MKTRLALILFAVLLAGCLDTIPTVTDQTTITCVTPTPSLPVCGETSEPTSTFTPEATQAVNTPTPVPATPSPTLMATPTSVIPEGTNLLVNGGFEGAWRQVIFPESNIFYSWLPYYCSEPYTPTPCVVPAEWNPPWSPFYFWRPEYKPAMPYAGAPYENRVRSGGNAQVFFATHGIMDAGVYQTIETVPGTDYVVTMYAQIWTAAEFKGGCLVKSSTGVCLQYGPPATSDVATEDDRRGMWAYIAVDPNGGINYFASSVLRSVHFGYADGLYDKYGEVTYTFTATSDKTTIFLGCGNRWANAHNDCYLDDASVVEAP